MGAQDPDDPPVDLEQNFLSVAQDAFRSVCDSFERSPERTAVTLVPFRPFLGSVATGGPGEPVKYANPEAAIAEITKHAQDWVGYVLVRRAEIEIGGPRTPAVLLQAWFYNNCLQIIRRFRELGSKVDWLEDAVQLAEPPPNHLLAPTRVVDAQGFASVRDVISQTINAAGSDYRAAFEVDWAARVASMALPAVDLEVPSFTWANMARGIARLSQMFAVGAPAPSVEQEIEVVCVQFEALCRPAPQG